MDCHALSGLGHVRLRCYAALFVCLRCPSLTVAWAYLLIHVFGLVVMAGTPSPAITVLVSAGLILIVTILGTVLGLRQNQQLR